MTSAPSQVHMAPFKSIVNQTGSHKVWETSGMPPGLSNSMEEFENHIYLVFSMGLQDSDLGCVGLGLEWGWSCLQSRPSPATWHCESATEGLCVLHTEALP